MTASTIFTCIMMFVCLTTSTISGVLFARKTLFYIKYKAVPLPVKFVDRQGIVPAMLLTATISCIAVWSPICALISGAVKVAGSLCFLIVYLKNPKLNELPAEDALHETTYTERLRNHYHHLRTNQELADSALEVYEKAIQLMRARISLRTSSEWSLKQRFLTTPRLLNSTAQSLMQCGRAMERQNNSLVEAVVTEANEVVSELLPEESLYRGALAALRMNTFTRRVRTALFRKLRAAIST